MRKRFLSFVLILCMTMSVIGTLPTTAFASTIDSGTCGDNLTWTLDDSGTLTISGRGEMKNYTYSSHAPWYSHCLEIKSVVIENGITKIGDYAFDGCSGLTEVHYNGNSKEFAKISIGERNGWLTNNALIYCTDKTIKKYGTCGDNLTWTLDDTGTFTISGSGKMDNYQYFYDVPWDSYTSEIKNVVIENGVTNIGSNAFFRCSGLASVTIPDSVTVIGDSAFDGCSGLTEVHYNSSLADFLKITVGNDNTRFINAKLYCADIVAIDYGTCGDNLIWVLDDTDTLTISGSGEMAPSTWNSYKSKIKNVVIENGVTSIGESAFRDYPNLASITIPGQRNGYWRLCIPWL